MHVGVVAWHASARQFPDPLRSSLLAGSQERGISSKAQGIGHAALVSRFMSRARASKLNVVTVLD